MVVIDGTTAFIGGINIGDEYAGRGESGERWRDMGVRIDGPVAGGLQKLFCDCWLGEGGDPARWTIWRYRNRSTTMMVPTS